MPKRYIVSISWDPQLQYNTWQTKIELYQIRKEFKLKLAPPSMLGESTNKVQYGVYCTKKFYQKKEDVIKKLNEFTDKAQKILKNKDVRDVTINIIYPI